MHHLTCIVRLTDAFVDEKKNVLTPDAVDMAQRAATELGRIAGRFGTELYYHADALMSAAIIADALNARNECLPATVNPSASLSGNNVWPFVHNLGRMATGFISWFGVTIMITEYAFIQEAFLTAINHWGYKRKKGLRQAFPYGSILLLKNGKEKIASILLNDQS
jgi:hypothetical protein